MSLLQMSCVTSSKLLNHPELYQSGSVSSAGKVVSFITTAKTHEAEKNQGWRCGFGRSHTAVTREEGGGEKERRRKKNAELSPKQP